MRITAAIGLAVVALLALMGVAWAQSGGEPDHINRWTFTATSGGVLTSTDFVVRGTVGQASTALASAPGGYGYSVAGIWAPHYVHVHPWPSVTTLPDMPEIPEAVEVEEGDIQPTDWLQMRRGGTYFPTTLNLPPFPALIPPTFPSTLGLPEMPTLTLMSYITDVFSPVISLTEQVMFWDAVITSSLLMPAALGEAMGIDVGGFAGGGGPADVDIELAGYTASELADELVTGMDVALSYLRSVRTIGVIGPTAAAMIIGIGWIAFVAFAKMVLKALFLVINLVMKLWRALPFT